MKIPLPSRAKHSWQAELGAAQEATREAGDYLLQMRGHATVVRKKAARDALLDVDLAAEQIVLSHLRATFPQDGILSEEAGQSNPDADRQWIVDPLDGSANFAHGSSLFGVAICLTVRQVPTVSVIYLPVQDERFTALRGQGAFLNETPIHVSEIASLEEATIHSGDFSKSGSPHENQDRLAIVQALAASVGRVRMIGTAATDVAYVACGRADGLVMRNHHLWDYQAGALLVKEAGGRVATHTSALDHSFLILSNAALQRPLGKVVQQAIGLKTRLKNNLAVSRR